MAEDKAKLLKSLRIERSAEAPAPPRRRRWATILAVAIALVGAGSAFAYYAFPDWRGARPAVSTAPQPSPAVVVAATTAAEPARPRALVASGYVVARRKATVAAEITGKVVEVLIEEGMVIKEGDVVARLDSVLAERDLALARSRADAAEAAIGAIAADLRDAERIFNRAQSLVARNAMSEADMTKAEARVGVLRAQLKQAQAQFETAKLDANRTADVLEKHHIRAPFNGVVVERSAQPGEMISPLSVGGFTRTGICTLVDMDSIEVEVDVNEAFIGRVQAGLPVEAVLDAYPDWTIPATVIAVVPTANREKATVKVRIGLKVKDPRILPDMAVKVTFEAGASAGDAGHDKSAAN
ncbi:MAG: efflux RND transporter periplasmic adaptor subunit [Hyphomicrobiales bacterium]|nr:efflux RND transporter periplasmic adaptor subunit [Hyphomicrobiales bacterium]MBV9428854.1 efflux RND transporter periplasmic adaptor subunit [Bradyrhizobiaceae bacterium]